MQNTNFHSTIQVGNLSRETAM